MRPCLSLLLFSASSALAVGCGPSISREVHDARAFRTDARCTQGPFELATRAEGARWGEGIELVACTPRAIHGRYEILRGDAPITSGEWGRTMHRQVSRAGADGRMQLESVYEDASTPDNARCVASDAELAVVGTSGGEAAPATTAPAGAPATAAPATVAAAPVELHEVASPGAGVESYALCDAQGLARVEIADLELDHVDANAELRVRLWSLEPNDFDGVFFVFRRFVMRPSVSDAEWQAHLDEEQRESEEEAREAQAEADERQRHCAAHHEDEDCWGEGGYDAHVARLRRSQEASLETALRGPPPEPVVEHHEPSGPPPAALAEERPPSPSVHADWVPGYWTWSGSAWGWLAGRWRVPEADITGGLTTHAPTAPPAPRTDDDQPPSPAPGAVWCSGHWQWAGSAFVWVKGSWQLPPRAGATWIGATWRIGGGGAVFVPGAWR